MFYFIYRIPMNIVPFIIAAAVIIWAFIMRKMPKKSEKAASIINIVLLLVSIFGIIYITVMRKGEGKHEIYLMPFHNLIEALSEKDVYRSMLMNIFLFVPFGLFTPFALNFKIGTGRKVIITVCAAVIFSAVIEAVQYIFGIGRCETDDVLCNAAGAAAGAISYILYSIKDR